MTATPSTDELETKLALLDALEERLAAQCRADFLTFVENIETPGAPVNEEAGVYYPVKLHPARHHKLVIDLVQGLADGRYDDIDGIMVFMPPGAAKSTYTSVLAPAWLMGRKPGTNVIATSYGDELVRKFGRRVRAIARSPDYERYMGCKLTGDNAAVNEWSLSNGSDYRSAGLLGTITGLRADYLFIDDPVKNREDADSQLIRDKTWDSYIEVCDTRLKPGGKIFVIMTRWHEDDICGRLLGEKWKGQSGLWRATDGKLFYVVNLPLLAEHADDPLGRATGDLLWPEWFQLKNAHRLRDNAKKGGTFARTWASLYQQRPAPDEGAILARSYWRRWEKKVPECSHIFLCYDTAFEEHEDADYSAMTAWGIFTNTSRKDSRGGPLEYNHSHVILLGAWQERCSAANLLDRVTMHAKLFRPDRILVEKRASGIQLIQEMQRLRLPVKPWLPPGKPGAKGKVPRAHAVAAMLEQGSVWYYPGPRTELVLDQCSAFPYGTNDDLCFVAGTMIATRRGLVPIEEVLVGDEALTPQGWRRVSAAGFTGMRPVVTRGALTGTGNHPVFDTEKGFIPLESVDADTVTMASTLSRATLWSLIKTIRRKPWNFAASYTGAWADGAATISANPAQTLAGRAPRGCTWQSGRARTGLCRMVTRFTTRMAIHLIAALKIWSAYQKLSIAHCLSRAWTWASSALTWTACDPSQLDGIALTRAGAGILKTRSAPAICSRGSISGLGTSFLARVGARFAGVISNTIRPGSESVRSAATTESAVAPVFNLTVEGAHCYYANGVLVHNCDTVTMALSYFRRSGMFETADDELDDGELQDAMMANMEAKRHRRSLYSGRPVRISADADEDESLTRSMTEDSRRRLYGG